MSYAPKYLSESSSIKHVTTDLQLEGVATKKDLVGITHVDTSSFALKTNLFALKTEVDKLDIPKLGTLPTDVAKLTNKVANDLVEKTDFNSLKTKFDNNETDNGNLETKVDNNHLTAETSINNLKTKVYGINLTKYVKKSDYDTKVGNLELKIPDVSGKLNTSDSNSKVSELENKIRSAESKPYITNLATKSSVTVVENKIPDVKGFVKKTDYSTEITSIKNDYVIKSAVTSQLNDLKSQHIADEVKKVDDKVKKSITDIVTAKNSLLHNKSVLDDLEREVSFNRGFYYYNKQSYFLFEPKSKSFTKNGGAIYVWISTGIHNDSNNTDLFSVNNSNNSPTLLIKNNRLGVTFNGNYMKQNKLGYAHGKIVNLYIVYELKNRRVDNPDFTVQNGLFGAVKITKNVNTSHYKYEGYGICFDGESSFSFGNRIDAKNVIVFGVNTSNSSHSANNTQNVYVLGKDFVQGITNTTIYAEKIYKTNFTEQSKKFVL